MTSSLLCRSARCLAARCLAARCLAAAGILSVAGIDGPAQADIVRLNSGGVLRGTLVDDEGTAAEATAAADSKSVQMTLLTGAVVEIPRDSIRDVEQRPIKFEVYETQLRRLPDTLAAHWQMAQWCRDENLDEQQAVHLGRVLDFDPGHREAHYGLGHTFYNDRWMTRDEYEQLQHERGFVKFDGKWIHEDDLKSVASDAASKKIRSEWYAKVRLWLKWATGTHPQRAADGLANLRTIRDEHAIPALVQFLAKDERPDVRRQFIETVRQIGTSSSVDPLAALALHDQTDTLRDFALESIPVEHQKIAQDDFVRELRNGNNLIVQRAAAALGRIGNDEAVPPLIRALVTTHTCKVRVPVEGYSYNASGGFNTGSPLPPDIAAGLRLGLYQGVEYVPYPGTRIATRLIPVSVTLENGPVLTSLRHLTSQDFGFNETRWERWWKVDRLQTTLAPDLP